MNDRHRVRVAASVALAAFLVLVGIAPLVADDGGASRSDLVTKGGGGEDTENAVRAGLVWLARHQELDGSWSAAKFSARCLAPACAGGGYPDYDIGLTALATLAFLGAGYTPEAQATVVDPVTTMTIPLGKVTKTALDRLVQQQDASGRFGNGAPPKDLYNQAIATMALSEAHRLAPAGGYGAAAQAAVGYLLKARNPYKAWRYQPRDGENDTSVSGWCLMALKTAEAAGLKVDRSTFVEVRLHIESLTEKDTGNCGYQVLEDAGVKVVVPKHNEDFANHQTMAAIGLLCRLAVPDKAPDPIRGLVVRTLVGDPPIWDRVGKTNDYYYWYYGTYALFHQDGPDGKAWKRWNAALKQVLVTNQVGEKGGCSQGSWDTDDRWGFEGGRLYATALNTLTLEVYYRCPWLGRR